MIAAVCCYGLFLQIGEFIVDLNLVFMVNQPSWAGHLSGVLPPDKVVLVAIATTISFPWISRRRDDEDV